MQKKKEKECKEYPNQNIIDQKQMEQRLQRRKKINTPKPLRRIQKRHEINGKREAYVKIRQDMNS